MKPMQSRRDFARSTRSRGAGGPIPASGELEATQVIASLRCRF